MHIVLADDGMAILSAFNSPELDIIGLTTIFGNVRTETATLNAFKLLDLASQAQVFGWLSPQGNLHLARP